VAKLAQKLVVPSKLSGVARLLRYVPKVASGSRLGETRIVPSQSGDETGVPVRNRTSLVHLDRSIEYSGMPASPILSVPVWDRRNFS
jgi:hypothetical protein